MLNIVEDQKINAHILNIVKNHYKLDDTKLSEITISKNYKTGDVYVEYEVEIADSWRVEMHRAYFSTIRLEQKHKEINKIHRYEINIAYNPHEKILYASALTKTIPD